MKLLDISPDFLNEELARKICRNITLKREYIKKYNLVGGSSEKRRNLINTFLAILTSDDKTFIDTYLDDATTDATGARNSYLKAQIENFKIDDIEYFEQKYINENSITYQTLDGNGGNVPNSVVNNNIANLIIHIQNDTDVRNIKLFEPGNENDIRDGNINGRSLFFYVPFTEPFSNTYHHNNCSIEFTNNRTIATIATIERGEYDYDYDDTMLCTLFSDETPLQNNSYMEIIVNSDNRNPNIYFGVFRAGKIDIRNINMNSWNDTYSLINVVNGNVSKDDREGKSWVPIQTVIKNTDTDTDRVPYRFTNNSTRIGCLLYDNKIYFYYNGELLTRVDTPIDHFGNMDGYNLEFIVLSETPATVTIQNSSPPEPPV